MKFLHIADLHIGKQVAGFSMIEDQRFVLNQIVEMTKTYETDAVLIAGDVYDKSQPSNTAIALFDDFLTALTEAKQIVCIISGNHDSVERLSFARQILSSQNIHIAGRYEGEMQKVTLHDAYGACNIYLLPFLSPPLVRPYFDCDISNYDDAIKAICKDTKLNPKERNVLMAHQFVVAGSKTPETSDSEQISVGGIDHVNLSAFDGFDYVALGHIHRPQQMGRETVRYAGSPLKYSFSEVHHNKSVVLVSMDESKTPILNYLPLTALHDMREIKGPISELIQTAKEDSADNNDYIHAILTDETPIYDAVGQLRAVYPNLMGISFPNQATEHLPSLPYLAEEALKTQTPLELFSDFFTLQTGNDLSEKAEAVLTDILETAKEVTI